MKELDPAGIENSQNSELQLNHKDCENRDDGSEIENKLIDNMLKKNTFLEIKFASLPK